MTKITLTETTDDGEVSYSIEVNGNETIMPVDIDKIFKVMDINIKYDSKKSLSYIKYKDKSFYVEHSFDYNEYLGNILDALKSNGIKNLNVTTEIKEEKSEDDDIKGEFDARCTKCNFCTVPYYSMNKLKENYPDRTCPDCGKETLIIYNRSSKVKVW